MADREVARGDALVMDRGGGDERVIAVRVGQRCLPDLPVARIDRAFPATRDDPPALRAHIDHLAAEVLGISGL